MRFASALTESKDASIKQFCLKTAQAKAGEVLLRRRGFFYCFVSTGNCICRSTLLEAVGIVQSIQRLNCIKLNNRALMELGQIGDSCIHTCAAYICACRQHKTAICAGMASAFAGTDVCVMHGQEVQCTAARPVPLF